MGEIRKSGKQRTIVKNWHHAQAPPWSISPTPASPQNACYVCEDAGIPLRAWGSPQKGSNQLLPRHICSRSWLWLLQHKPPGLWMPQASIRHTSSLVPTKALMAHAKAELQGPGQTSAPPDFGQQLQGAVIWDSEPCLRCRMLFWCFCSLVFISPVQSRRAPSNTLTSN